MPLIGPFLVASGLLVVAGLAKAWRPDDTARALTTLVRGNADAVRPRRARAAVRAGALGEVALGLWALALPRALPAALVASSYLGFALVVAGARRRGGPLSTCGCFGRPDTPPTRLHLVLDVALAVSAAVLAIATTTGATLAGVLAHQPWGGVPLLFVVGVGTWLAVLALSSLASLEGARRTLTPERSRAVVSP